LATGLTDKKFYDCHLDAIGALVVDSDGDGALVFLCVHLLSVETTHYGYWVYETTCFFKFLLIIDLFSDLRVLILEWNNQWNSTLLEM
jgi:hypothetical protein